MDGTPGIMGATSLNIDAAGAPSYDYPPGARPLYTCAPVFSMSEDREDDKGIMPILETILVISGLTISFMHAKNVQLLERVAAPRLQKARIRNRKKPFVKYYVLEINPLKKLLSEEGNSSVNGVRQALHVCRGHFKDYRDGRGLFGKFRGIYWWQEHARGNISAGVITKDYMVNPGSSEHPGT